MSLVGATSDRCYPAPRLRQCGVALRGGAVQFNELVTQVVIDGQGFEDISRTRFQADVHLVGPGPNGDIRGSLRNIAQARNTAYRYGSLGKRLEDALVTAGHPKELDENLVALFADLHPHDRRPTMNGPHPMR